MSQHEILQFLKESPRTWYRCRDISTYLECKTVKIARALKQLRKFNWVEYKKENKTYAAAWLYRHKKVEKKIKQGEK